VPEYARNLDRILGPGGLEVLVEHVRHCEHESVSLARRLFAAWLGRIVGLRRPVALHPAATLAGAGPAPGEEAVLGDLE